MRIFRTKDGAIIQKGIHFYTKKVSDWDSFLNRKGLLYALKKDIEILHPSDSKILVDVF